MSFLLGRNTLYVLNKCSISLFNMNQKPNVQTYTCIYSIYKHTQILEAVLVSISHRCDVVHTHKQPSGEDVLDLPPAPSKHTVVKGFPVDFNSLYPKLK